MNEWKTMVGPLERLVMDRHHYKPISSGHSAITPAWDMGNAGHDRVVCVLACVWSVVGLFGEGNRLTGGPFSMIQFEGWIFTDLRR